MKKHTIIIVFTLITAILVALFVFRHVIIGHALKVSVNKKTNETIELSIGDIYYDIFNSTVSFTGSELLFNNTFLNEEKTIELSELKFDFIKISNISLFKLMFQHEIIAQKISIKKPSLWFMENNNPKPFKEEPREIIKSLKKHHDILKDLTIIVDEVEISHGKIDLKSLINDTEHNGSLEFKLLLKKINTTNKEDYNNSKILFAEEHFVKLSKFTYTMPNGNSINIDSVVFSSNSNQLLTTNVKLVIANGISDPRINRIVATLKRLLISDINFDAIEDLHDIEIGDISLSDASVKLQINELHTQKSIVDTIRQKPINLGPLNKLKISVLNLKGINISINNNNADSVLDIKNLSFRVKDIVVDSTVLSNKTPDVDFNSLHVSSGTIAFNESKSGTKLTLDKLNFTESEQIISIDGIQVNNTNINKPVNLLLSIAELNLNGISARDFFMGKQLKVGLDIKNPIVDMELRNTKNSPSTKNKLKSEQFEITNVTITKGKFHVLNHDNFDLEINNFNLSSGLIHFNDFNKVYELNHDNFVLNTDKLKVNLYKKDLRIVLKSLSFLENTLRINYISTHINNKSNINTSLNIKQLVFGGINMQSIYNDSVINLSEFTIVNPQISGDVKLNSGLNKNNPKSSVHFPLKSLSVTKFMIKHGLVKLELNLKDDELKINSNFNLAVNDFIIKDKTDTTWFSRLLWAANLVKPTIIYHNYSFTCNSISSDKQAQTLSIQDINIEEHKNKNSIKDMRLNLLTIKSVNFEGLDYNAIINKQKPSISSLKVNKPYFDIEIAEKRNKHAGSSINLSTIVLPFNLKNIEINHLAFNIDNKDSVSNKKIQLGDLNIKYDLLDSENIFDGLKYFNANSLTFTDTLNKSYNNVGSIAYNQLDKKFSITNYNGKSDNRIHYIGSNIDIAGVTISQDYPHKISIQGIDIDDVDISVKSKDEKKKKEDISLYLPKAIMSLVIDTISGSNIKFTHTIVDDTSTTSTTLDSLGFLIKSVVLDSTVLSNKQYLFAQSISVDLSKNKFISSNKLYATSIKALNYNFYKKQLVIDSFLMKPRYKPEEFFKKAIYQIGKMDVVTSKIVCSNIRFNKLIDIGNIHMGSIDVYGLEMFIFKNKRYEINPDLYIKMPQEAVLSIPKIITIDSLITHNSFIQYKQLNKKSVVPGVIFLDDINTRFFNITNNLDVIDNTSSMIVKFNAKLLGESTIDLKMTFPILSPAYDFWITGRVEKVDFTKLNSMTQNLVGITLKKGVGEVDIPLISGNSKHSKGSVAFKYRKLKVELYDRDKANNATGLGGNMANLLLNDILIKSNNPGFLGKTRKGEVYFKRNTQKSIVYYTWKSVLSGIMSTMGYNNKEQRQEKRATRRRRR